MDTTYSISQNITIVGSDLDNMSPASRIVAMHAMAIVSSTNVVMNHAIMFPQGFKPITLITCKFVTLFFVFFIKIKCQFLFYTISFLDSRSQMTNLTAVPTLIIRAKKNVTCTPWDS